MAQPGAVIDVVGAEAGAHQFLEQIRFLIRSLGAAETGQGARAGFGTDFAEPSSGAVQRLLPGRHSEMRPRISRIDIGMGDLRRIVPSDQRLG